VTVWDGPRVRQQPIATVVRRKTHTITIYPTGQAGAKRIYRTKQWLFEKGIFRCLPLFHLTRGQAHGRGVAAGLQLFKAAPGVGLCTAAGIHLIRFLLITKKH